MPMMHPCVKVQNAGHVFGIDDLKIHDIIQPVLASTVPVVQRDGQGVLSPAEQAIQSEFYFEDISGIKLSKVALLEPCIGAVHVHTDAIANENAGDGASGCTIELPGDADADHVAAAECAARFAGAVG